MTKEQFIEKIAPIIVKYASQYNVLCPSAVIAQAVLESNGGMSELGQNAFNYFGLKYRPNRCPSACGIYYKVGSEQDPVTGQYTSSAMQWMKFSNMENGVKGYFEFTDISTYKSIKGVSDPKTYLENIKKAGYATSLKYVDNLMNVINKYNLTKYDTKENNKEVNQMSNITSSTYLNETIHGMKVNSSVKCNSTNYQTTSGRKVEYIVIHYTGNAKDAAINNAKYFQGANRKSSAHFFVDDTSIYQSVDLKNSAWHCGGSNYRHPKCRNLNSIGIEMCCTAGNYMVSNKTQENTAYLCARLCKFLNISASEVDTYVLTHNQITGKACPRQYVNNPSEFVAFKKMVKEILNGSVSSTPSTSSTTRSYLMKGDKGDAVGKLQENLNYLGYSCGTVDKSFGSKTDKALRDFQKAYKLTVDGKYGETSKRVLEEAITKKKNTTSKPTTTSGYVHNGIDYSPVFNPTFYSNRYADLKKAFGTDSKKLFKHFIEHGVQEGRVGSAEFNVHAYKSRYLDLQNAFGNDLPKYYEHWIRSGKRENRTAI